MEEVILVKINEVQITILKQKQVDYQRMPETTKKETVLNRIW